MGFSIVSMSFLGSKKVGTGVFLEGLPSQKVAVGSLGSVVQRSFLRIFLVAFPIFSH